MIFTAAIILKQSFIYEWNVNTGDGSYDFFDYMTNPEKFKPELHNDTNDMYYDYMDYMKNEEKSDGAFDSEYDHLSEEQIDNYRMLEFKSQQKGCPKYLGVISFENDYLLQFGIMNTHGEINHRLLKDYARLSINAMINESKKLKNDNVYWTAAIHENTDNIHIHFQLLEYEKLEDRKKKYRDMDSLEPKCFEALKSKMVNMISPQKDRQKYINQVEREVLIPNLQAQFTNTDGRILDLYKKISQSKKPRKWQYGSYEKSDGHREDKMKKQIDSVVRNIINSNNDLKNIYREFEKELNDYDDWNTYVYGKRKDVPRDNQVYSYNKREDFYRRAGNSLLKYMREFGDELKAVDKQQQSAKPYLSEKEMKKIVKEIIISEDNKLKKKTHKSYRYNKPKAIHAHRSLNGMIRRLQHEYEAHIRQLQREYQREQESNEKQQYEYIDDGLGLKM